MKNEKLLKLWRMRQITIEGKIFKTLVISKIVHLALECTIRYNCSNGKNTKANLFGKTEVLN